MKMLNFTNLSENEAVNIYEKMVNLTRQGETIRENRLERAEKMLKLYRGDMWDTEAVEFFESLGVEPYSFPIHRNLINNLVSKQRKNRFSLKPVVHDPAFFRRNKKGRDEFVQENIELFESIKEAYEYYDKYSDDELQKTHATLLNNIRYINKAKYAESECFQQGLITGVDFLKADIGNKISREGGIEISRVSQRKMIFDETIDKYEPTDWEFVGEIDRIYRSDLITMYPDRLEEIEKYYENETNIREGLNLHQKEKEDFSDWNDFYKFDQGAQTSDDQNKIKIVTIYYRDVEERLQVLDKKTQTNRVAVSGATQEEILDELTASLVQEKFVEVSKLGDPAAIEQLLPDKNPDLMPQIQKEITERYEIKTIYEPVWIRCRFTWQGLLEFKIRPLPIDTHPYYPYYPEFVDGQFFSFLESLEHIIIGLNKALIFRELMIGSGAKDLVIIDRDIMDNSGYSIEDVAEQYTAVGGMLFVKLKAGKKVSDVMQTVTTVQNSIPALNEVIRDYDNRLYQISGVNLAQLGIEERTKSASLNRQQIIQSETNNGHIFDNFIRTVEGFYNDKVLPMVAYFAKVRKKDAIRILGDEYAPWLAMPQDDDGYTLFEKAVRLGMCNTVLVPEEEDSQMKYAYEQEIMQMAMAGMVPVELAIKYSSIPDKHNLLRDLRKEKLEQAKTQAAVEAEYMKFQQALMKTGLPLEEVDRTMKELRVQQMKEQLASEKDAKNRRNGVMGGLNPTQQSNEPARLNKIVNVNQGGQNV